MSGKVAPDAGEIARLRDEAWRMFDDGEFVQAADAFSRLAELGEIDELGFHALVEILVDRGQPAKAITALDRQLGRCHGGGPAVVPWASALFDLQVRCNAGPEALHDAAMRMLEALAATDDAGIWLATLTDGRLAEIERAFPTPMAMLEALEQQAYAPGGTGIAERAIAKIEEIGHVCAGETAVGRAAERLLHALGNAEAAYRVERARRAAASRAAVAPSDETAGPTAVDLSGLVVTIAGGHPALRSMIERDLAKSGVARVRSIPSATEANRVGREVQGVIAGSDLVVLVVWQLAHSTSDQVRKAAARVGVPVVTAESAGIGGVRRAVERFVAERTPN